MKVLLFISFALFACYQAVAVSAKKQEVALLEQDYAVDRVLEQLEGFRQVTVDLQSSADAVWTATDAASAEALDGANTVLSNKRAECAGIDTTVSNGRAQEEVLRSNIQAARDTLAGNQQKEEAAADARCAASLLALSQIGEAQEAVEFLTYLRGRVADPAFADYIRDQSGAFVQLKSALATKQEVEVLSFIAKHHVLSTLQKKQYQGEDDLEGQLTARVRTDEEVGTDYQDNDRGALSVENISDDYGTVDSNVQELLGFIDQLIALLEDNVAKLQQAETVAVQAFLQYVAQLHDQNYVLQQYIAAAEVALAELIAVNDGSQAAAGQCTEGIAPLEQAVAAIQTKRADDEQRHTEAHNDQQARIDLLAEAIDVYRREVYNVATESEKARADDYLDNQVFDSTENYASRGSLPTGAL